MDTKTNITKIIKDLNHAVATGKVNKLDSLFHEDVKILSPDMKILGEGKTTCIKSYADFISKAKIEEYNDDVTNVSVYENTAVVFFTYSMAWLMDGKSFREQGKELYVLTKENDNWLIVLRKLVASDSQ